VIRLRHGPSGVGIQTGAKHFSFLRNVQIGSGPQVSYSTDTRLKRSGRDVVTNEWSYTSASPVCLHGVYTDLHFFPLYTSALPSANFTHFLSDVPHAASSGVHHTLIRLIAVFSHNLTVLHGWPYWVFFITTRTMAEDSLKFLISHFSPSNCHFHPHCLTCDCFISRQAW
jgi:hypothetical protein